jgi:NAD(P)-dependent dehydrogenase (short-subunit alcohol dehydrogenase family)
MIGTSIGIEILSQSGGGTIVNTASIAALSPMPNDPVYAATKAAVVLFTQSCAEVAKTHGVRVNAVLPGMVDTSMITKTGDGETAAEWLAPMLGMVDLLDPARIADAVAAFIDDDTKAGQTTIVMNELRQAGAS